jgi:hypothetical protein
VSRFGRRADRTPESAQPVPDAGGTTITAELVDGPLKGRTIDVEAVEGRPPKTVDVDAADGGTCRYCLGQWNQTGHRAAYTFLYTV